MVLSILHNGLKLLSRTEGYPKDSSARNIGTCPNVFIFLSCQTQLIITSVIAFVKSIITNYIQQLYERQSAMVEFHDTILAAKINLVTPLQRKFY